MRVDYGIMITSTTFLERKHFLILICIDCRHGRRLKQAKAGDSVTMAINGDKEDMDNIRVGSVLSDIRNPIPMVTTFLAQVKR
jgi:translation elongation factor EF-1alpha